MADILHSRSLRKMTGTHPWGPSRKWPARLLDALVVIENQERQIEAKMREADRP